MIDNPDDIDAGPEGPHWYCEEHPARLMGHDGCQGAGIPACARKLWLLMHAQHLMRHTPRKPDDAR